MIKGNMKKITTQLGFTMIELLIVITILGILAVAVLSAINPIEQINRGRDTGSQSDAEQLLSSIDRYNAFQGYYPWQYSADDLDVSMMVETYGEGTWTRYPFVSNLDNGGIPVPLTAGYPAAMWEEVGDPPVLQPGTDFICPVVARLSSGDLDVSETRCRGAQELKDSFITRVTGDSTRALFVYNSGRPGSSTYVCFIPQSSAFEVAASDRCDAGFPEDVALNAADFICATEDGMVLRSGVGIVSDVPMTCLP